MSRWRWTIAPWRFAICHLPFAIDRWFPPVPTPSFPFLLSAWSRSLDSISAFYFLFSPLPFLLSLADFCFLLSQFQLFPRTAFPISAFPLCPFNFPKNPVGVSESSPGQARQGPLLHHSAFCILHSAFNKRHPGSPAPVFHPPLLQRRRGRPSRRLVAVSRRAHVQVAP